MPSRADGVSQWSCTSSGSLYCLLGCRSYNVFSTLGGSACDYIWLHFWEKSNLHSCLSYPHLTATFITDAPQRNPRAWSSAMPIHRQTNCLMTARLGAHYLEILLVLFLVLPEWEKQHPLRFSPVYYFYSNKDVTVWRGGGQSWKWS